MYNIHNTYNTLLYTYILRGLLFILFTPVFKGSKCSGNQDVTGGTIKIISIVYCLPSKMSYICHMGSKDDIIYTREELENKLTIKENRFCHFYIVDWNSSKAARDAGYSKRTCGSIGYENLKKPHIRQYIAFIKDDYEREAGLSKLMVLNEFKKIAMYANIAEMFTDWTVRETFENIKAKNPEIMCAISEISTRTKVQKSADNELTEVEYVKVKLHDKQKALENINKMLGYNAADKVESVNKEKIEYVNVSKQFPNAYEELM
jgi:phage terminase small subunit